MIASALELVVVLLGVSIAALSSVSATTIAEENDPDGNTRVARLFADDSLLAVTIEAPLTTLMKDRPDEQYLDGMFSFTGDDGEEKTVELKLRTRGKYRREKKHCDFAPIRLNFRETQVEGTVFAGQDKLKMVTHCRSKNRNYEQLVLREFLAYRFLNVITDKSFGVRLLQINYVDTEGAEAMTRFGFVIEDDDAVAARNGMKPVKTGNISGDDLDHRQQNLVSVFQYLIGNTEYSMTIGERDEGCCHNTDLLSATDGPPFTPLAYDFDFAGIVNAPYAQPKPRYKLRNVRQRLYRGACSNNKLLPDTFHRFIDKKDAIYGIVNDLEYLNSKSRRSVTRYLNMFYKSIAKPKSVNAYFIRKCESSD
jgi:hypothetical protein